MVEYCSGLVVEYWTHGRDVAGLTHTRSTASNLTYFVLRSTHPPTLSRTGNEAMG